MIHFIAFLLSILLHYLFATNNIFFYISPLLYRNKYEISLHHHIFEQLPCTSWYKIMVFIQGQFKWKSFFFTFSLLLWCVNSEKNYKLICFWFEGKYFVTALLGFFFLFYPYHFCYICLRFISLYYVKTKTACHVSC